MCNICDCWPCFICICGCRATTHRCRRTPEPLRGALVAGQRYHCAHCQAFREAGAFRRNQWFTCFFIPICRYSRGSAYIGCIVCKNAIQPGSEAVACASCAQPIEGRQRFCPHCGHVNGPATFQRHGGDPAPPPSYSALEK